ncbi:AroM family protein [Cronobacter sakazakii]|uniref:AroM family protein n=1 Tax=Cronobacter sakazakii TaxID=28141 RepID=UPI000CF19856|nr:AroM family protein [Cronobacter sakazakii]ELY2618158.1 AroM family protein [Cronobacter sakazakii]ELY2634646.1 AroM family protein [Cronobacter sakazakii]ELY2662379.1 AroM family protein [Cronobacter sakazakii]ELY4113649.1 AroM family protein [Cronobacter sakazakii]ELY4497336.1 AroM family protein [Cronobacter sakazakii]
MRATLAILTIGVVPVSEILPLLTEHFDEQHITHISLMGKLSRAEAMDDYGASGHEETIITMLADGEKATVSKAKTERALQSVIEVLDNQGYDVILLMSTQRFSGLRARNAILLEPERIIPPLVASIVDGHQVGVIVPIPELMDIQAQKWQVLENPPLYALANPFYGTEDELVGAGRDLLARGADVLLLDCLGFHQKHRDLLQKALDVPVLLSNVLVARLASELLI